MRASLEWLAEFIDLPEPADLVERLTMGGFEDVEVCETGPDLSAVRVGRVVTRERLFGGNRESFFQSFFTSDSILVWVVSTYGRRRREYGELLRGSEPVGFCVLEFSHPGQAARFLREQDRSQGST